MRISDLSSDVCSSDLFYPLCQPTHGNHDSPHPPAQWKNRPQRWLRQGLNAPRVEALFPSPPIFRWAGYFLARTCSTSLDLEVDRKRVEEGKSVSSTCSSRWAPYNKKKKKQRKK